MIAIFFLLSLDVSSYADKGVVLHPTGISFLKWTAKCLFIWLAPYPQWPVYSTICHCDLVLLVFSPPNSPKTQGHDLNTFVLSKWEYRCVMITRRLCDTSVLSTFPHNVGEIKFLNTASIQCPGSSCPPRLTPHSILQTTF